jgi:hypothetical protein
MKKSRALMVVLFVFCTGGNLLAQTNAAKGGLFTVNENEISATLEVEGTPLVQKYAHVFEKHKLDPTSATTWNSVLGQIIGIKEWGLYIDGDADNDVRGGIIMVSATSPEKLAQVLKTVDSILSTPETLDAFLTEMDELPKK